MKLVITILVLCFASCVDKVQSKDVTLSDEEIKEQRLWSEINNKKQLLKNGDLITRAGTDVISASLRNFNKQDKAYSHAGIAFIEDDRIYVYHTLAGEENPSDKMMREPFDSFVNPKNKLGVGIFRYELDGDEVTGFDSSMKYYFTKGLLFDKSFDLKNDSTMYCAEIIYKCLKKVTNNRIILPTTKAQNVRIKNPAFKNKVYKEIEYVAVDNLYLNSFCKEIARISYE